MELEDKLEDKQKKNHSEKSQEIMTQDNRQTVL